MPSSTTKFLPKPSHEHCRSFGQLLRATRGDEHSVVTAARVIAEHGLDYETAGFSHLIENLEAGDLTVSPSDLRFLARAVYKSSFDELLEQWYEDLPRRDGATYRPFRQDIFVRLSYCTDGVSVPGALPQFFIGGSIDGGYVWSVPLAKLEGAALATEAVELPPWNARQQKFLTSNFAERDETILQVVVGRIIVQTDESSVRPIDKGQTFVVRGLNYVIRNNGRTPALVLFIRAPQA